MRPGGRPTPAGAEKAVAPPPAASAAQDRSPAAPGRQQRFLSGDKALRPPTASKPEPTNSDPQRPEAAAKYGRPVHFRRRSRKGAGGACKSVDIPRAHARGLLKTRRPAVSRYCFLLLLFGCYLHFPRPDGRSSLPVLGKSHAFSTLTFIWVSAPLMFKMPQKDVLPRSFPTQEGTSSTHTSQGSTWWFLPAFSPSSVLSYTLTIMIIHLKTHRVQWEN